MKLSSVKQEMYLKHNGPKGPIVAFYKLHKPGRDSDDIRQEAIDRWITGRTKFLQQYRAREPFYYTGMFSTEQAHANIDRELRMLAEGRIQ